MRVHRMIAASALTMVMVACGAQSTQPDYGTNAIGNPNVFVVRASDVDGGDLAQAGDLVVNCQAPRVWCDDEGS